MASYLCMVFPAMFGGPLDCDGKACAVQKDVRVGAPAALVYGGVQYTGAVVHTNDTTFCIAMEEVLPLGAMSHTVDVGGKAGGLLVQAT